MGGVRSVYIEVHDCIMTFKVVFAFVTETSYTGQYSLLVKGSEHD